MIPRYFGMDIHKQFTMVVAVNAQQEVVLPATRVPNDELDDWVARHVSDQDEVALEVTTNTWPIYDLLNRYAGRVAVTNPYKTKLIAQARIKSDKVDALALARLLVSGFVCEVWVPDEQTREHRALAAHYARLQKQATRVKNQLHNLLRRHNLCCPEHSLLSQAGRTWLSSLVLSELAQLQLRQLLAQLDLLQAQLDDTDRCIARLAATDPRVPRIMQLTGLGYFTAFGLLATIGDFSRFPTPDSLPAYAGLVPSLHQSGNRSYSGHLTKTGSSFLRWLMVEAAQAAIRWDPHWKAIFDRIAHRRGPNIAVAAVARKLMVVLWHLFHDSSTYFYLQPQTFVSKLQQWAYRIGRAHLPAASAKAFVQLSLQELGLEPLAQSLVSQRPTGKLLVPSA